MNKSALLSLLQSAADSTSGEVPLRKKGVEVTASTMLQELHAVDVAEVRAWVRHDDSYARYTERVRHSVARKSDRNILVAEFTSTGNLYRDWSERPRDASERYPNAVSWGRLRARGCTASSSPGAVVAAWLDETKRTRYRQGPQAHADDSGDEIGDITFKLDQVTVYDRTHQIPIGPNEFHYASGELECEYPSATSANDECDEASARRRIGVDLGRCINASLMDLETVKAVETHRTSPHLRQRGAPSNTESRKPPSPWIGIKRLLRSYESGMVIPSALAFQFHVGSSCVRWLVTAERPALPKDLAIALAQLDQSMHL